MVAFFLLARLLLAFLLNFWNFGLTHICYLDFWYELSLLNTKHEWARKCVVNTESQSWIPCVCDLQWICKQELTWRISFECHMCNCSLWHQTILTISTCLWFVILSIHTYIHSSFFFLMDTQIKIGLVDSKTSFQSTFLQCLNSKENYNILMNLNDPKSS